MDSDHNPDPLSVTVGSSEGNPRASSTPLPPGTSRGPTPSTPGILDITTIEEFEERVLAVVGRRLGGCEPRRAGVEASFVLKYLYNFLEFN